MRAFLTSIYRLCVRVSLSSFNKCICNYKKRLNVKVTRHSPRYVMLCHVMLFHHTKFTLINHLSKSSLTPFLGFLNLQKNLLTDLAIFNQPFLAPLLTIAGGNLYQILGRAPKNDLLNLSKDLELVTDAIWRPPL